MVATTATLGRNDRAGAMQVPRSGGKCASCGRVIAAGEKYFAAVRECQAGIERLDLSAECWEPFEKSGLLAFWQTTMTHHEEKKKLFVDDEVLCTLFERLGGVAETAKVNFRFVLGLILMRKRLVLYDGSRQAGDRNVWIVRMKAKPEQLEMINPHLDELQVAQVSQQLGQILNEEL